MDQFPPGTHLGGLKDEAKSGDPDALRRFTPFFSDLSTLKLNQAQLVIGREYGFASWPQLKISLEQHN